MDEVCWDCERNPVSQEGMRCDLCQRRADADEPDNVNVVGFPEVEILCAWCDENRVEEEGEQCELCQIQADEDHAVERYENAMEAEAERQADRWDRDY